MKSFDSLSEREIPALAISLEEEDERVYADYAEGLRKDFPATAAVFDGMRQEESGHRRRLIELSRAKFGDHIPLIRRQDVRGFVTRRPVWLVQPLGLETVRGQAAPWKWNPTAFVNGPRRAPAMRMFANCWTTLRKRSARTKTAPRN